MSPLYSSYIRGRSQTSGSTSATVATRLDATKFAAPSAAASHVARCRPGTAEGSVPARNLVATRGRPSSPCFAKEIRTSRPSV